MRSSGSKPGRQGNSRKSGQSGKSRFQRRMNDDTGRGRRSERPDWQPDGGRGQAKRGQSKRGQGRDAQSRGAQSRGGEPAFRTRGGAGGRDDRRSRFDADDRRSGRGEFRSSGRTGERGGFREDRRGGYRDDRRGDRGGFRNDDRGRGGYRDERGYRDGRGFRDDRGGRRDYSRGDDRRGGRDDFRSASQAKRRDERNAKQPRNFENDVVHEKLEATAIDSSTIESDFASLGLGDGIVRALAAQGVTTPFPIQAGTIPASIEGRHVLGRAATGSGKTVAFGAPVVERLLRTKSKEKRQVGRSPRALILAPTRELAEQINRTMLSITREVGLFTVLITGGTKQQPQVASLEKGVDIVIGTPGRLEDLIDQRRLNLGRVEIAVLDEADHMAELGFIEPVGRLLRQTRPESQKLLFSATLDKEVEALVKEFLTDPAIYEAADLEQVSDAVEHTVLVADRREKDAVLANLASLGIKSVFFTRTRAYADRLADQFAESGIRATAMHGDLSQARRTRGLEKLRRGKVDVLVATDVAARGIHVDEIELVVQADPPDDHKAYVHRAGRTGRAGASGHVVTVIAPTRRRKMQELLERAEREVVMIPVDATSDLGGILGLGR